MYGDALTTIERVKKRLGINHTDFDTIFETLIKSVTSRIQQMCGRRFIQGTWTHELHDGADVYGQARKFLILKNAPVDTVSAVQYDDGSNGTPDWTDFDAEDYRIDLALGVIHFPKGMPVGFGNIRITYTGGFSGTTFGIDNSWIFNVVPGGLINGVNLAFTLPENAGQIVVYADGMREKADNIAHVSGTDDFTFAAGRAPTTTLAVDYFQSSSEDEEDVGASIPFDLVDLTERAVVKLFKSRDGEGKDSETFGETTIKWRQSTFTAEDIATIKNYRRGYSL